MKAASLREVMSLVDWVNSFDLPSCSLVDNLQDLKNGVVVGDIVGTLLGQNLKISNKDAFANWSVILQALSVSFDKEFDRISPESVLNDQRFLILILKTLMNLKTCSMSIAQKSKIVDWLQSLQIFRKFNIKTVPEIFSNGVALGTLVNRLEGRNSPIKGIDKNPKNKTTAILNISKVLDYLRQFPRIKHRFLWSAAEITEGDQTVIWGLLEDIKSFYSVKILKPRKSNLSFKESSKKSSRFFRTFTPKSPTEDFVRSVSRQSERNPMDKTKEQVTIWLSALGLEFQRDLENLRDPVSNGILLCRVLSILAKDIVTIDPSPKTMNDVLKNFRHAVSIVNSTRTVIPIWMLKDPEILLGDSESFWKLLSFLKSSYPYAEPIPYWSSDLRYGALKIKEVEEDVVDWLTVLKLYSAKKRPKFAEVVPRAKSGVLWAEIANKMTSEKIEAVKNPTTFPACLGNIRKSLEIIRKIPGLNTRFVWSEKEIAKGNTGVILGLLEDIMKVYDLKYAQKEEEAEEEMEMSMEKAKNVYENNRFQRIKHDIENAKTAKRRCKSLVFEDPYMRWLKALGFDFPSTLNFQKPTLQEFTNGVLLCDIISKVERITVPLVDRKPADNKACLRNIRRALNLLEKKCKFPKDITNCDYQILNGDKVCIVNLLKALLLRWENKI